MFKRVRRFAGGLVAVTALVVAPFAPAASATFAPAASATSGTLVITSSTTLSEDHAGTVVLARNGITLDCAGHSVIGGGLGSGPGVSLRGVRAATVKNCNIMNFDYGVLLVDAHGNTVRGNASTNNHDRGFHLQVSSHNTLADNRADHNAVHGVAAVGGGENTLKGNSAEGNEAVGFSIIHSNRNTLVGNFATSNVNGFSIQSSSENALRDNVSSGNVLYGFDLSPFTDHEQPQQNVLSENVADGNGWSGFFVRDASFNRIADNSATSNGLFDAEQIGASFGNSWVGNTFGTTSGI